jgi:hypothetical protein
VAVSSFKTGDQMVKWEPREGQITPHCFLFLSDDPPIEVPATIKRIKIERAVRLVQGCLVCSKASCSPWLLPR